jgi:hypothetical protein
MLSFEPSRSMATMRKMASMTPSATAVATAAAATAITRVKARQQTMRRDPNDVVVVVM